jgi:hypothetical protein
MVDHGNQYKTYVPDGDDAADISAKRFGWSHQWQLYSSSEIPDNNTAGHVSCDKSPVALASCFRNIIKIFLKEGVDWEG